MFGDALVVAVIYVRAAEVDALVIVAERARVFAHVFAGGLARLALQLQVRAAPQEHRLSLLHLVRHKFFRLVAQHPRLRAYAAIHFTALLTVLACMRTRAAETRVFSSAATRV